MGNLNKKLKIFTYPYNHGSIVWSFDLNTFLYLDKLYTKKINLIPLSELKKHSKEISVQLNSPLELSWHITSKCNMNCEYCLGPKNIKSVGSKKEKIIMDQLNENNVIRVNISGGEPFLHPRLLKILKYLKKNNHWVSITTNGYNSYKFIPQIQSLIDQMMISIDSIEEKEIRMLKNTKNKNILKNIIKTVNISKEYNIPIRISTLITKRHHRNPKELENFIKTVRKWGVNELTMIQFIPRARARLVKNKFALPNLEYFDIVEKSQNKYNTSKFRILTRNLDRYKGYLVINPDGKIFTLDKNGNDIELGDIFQDKLKNVFQPFIYNFYKI